MRKLFMYNMVSADGFFAGIDGNIDWHVVDAEFDAFAVEFNTRVYNVDTVLFGKTTYEMFADYWPKALIDSSSDTATRELAQFIEDLEKHVFSTTLDKVAWKNAILHKEIDPETMKALKEKDGGDIVIWGSGTICSQLAKYNLIDEYVFMINPVILGQGKSLFPDVANDMKLERISVREFTSGNTLVTFKPKI